jgi:hypothetical protein
MRPIAPIAVQCVGWLYDSSPFFFWRARGFEILSQMQVVCEQELMMKTKIQQDDPYQFGIGLAFQTLRSSEIAQPIDRETN